MSGPISPSDIAGVRSANLPQEVFDAFNEMIAKYYTGSSSTFTQDEVASLLLAKMAQRLPDVTRDMMYKEHWLDVEEVYRAKGWRVSYDKPGYNESYAATFTFKAGKQP